MKVSEYHELKKKIAIDMENLRHEIDRLAWKAVDSFPFKKNMSVRVKGKRGLYKIISVNPNYKAVNKPILMIASRNGKGIPRIVKDVEIAFDGTDDWLQV